MNTTPAPAAQVGRGERIAELAARGQVVARQDGTADASGQFERLSVVRSTTKYPLLRIRQRILRSPVTGREDVLTTSACVADHVVVRLREGKSRQDAERIARRHGTVVRKAMRAPRFYLVGVVGTDVGALDRTLRRLRGERGVVEYAEPDGVVEAIDTTPNDPSFGELWGLHQANGHDIDAPAAWDYTTGGTDVLVAVIDTGIDYTHPDLAANIWTNPGEIPGNGVDDDGNGFVDDVHGWDFAHDDNDPMDDHYHGTHCAGTIGAVGNNGTGVCGVNWTVRMAAVKFLAEGGSGFNSDAIDSIYYAAQIGAKVLSNSWGGDEYSEAMRDAILEAGASNALFVAAAGNDSSNNDLAPTYPVGYDCSNIIAVAATDRDDALASFSNYGQMTVDLGAPGVDILSTAPEGEYKVLSGTSMATPHVAGGVALLMHLYPQLSPSFIKDLLLGSVDPVPSLSGRTVAGGRMNLRKAIESLRRLRFDQPRYFTGIWAVLELIDYDASGEGSQLVDVSTSSGDQEALSLAEDSLQSGVFTSRIWIAHSPVAVQGNGSIEGVHGTILTVTSISPHGDRVATAVVDLSLVITVRPPLALEVPGETTSWVVEGENNGNVRVDMLVTNEATGEAHAFVATNGWTAPAVAIASGFNTLRISGINAHGFSDEVVVTVFHTGPSGVTNYVSRSGGHVWPFTSWATAATTVQDAVYAAAAGNLVLVTNGTYDAGQGWIDGQDTPARVALYKAVTVASVNGPSVTTIRGVGPDSEAAVRCAYLTNGAVLSGFALTNGHTRTPANDYDPTGYGGGALLDHGGTLSNCFVGSCSASWGGGVYAWNGGLVTHCEMAGDRSEAGGNGACVEGASKVTYSVVRNCTGSDGGAVLGWSGGAVEDSAIMNNDCSGVVGEDLRTRVVRCVIHHNGTIWSYGGGVSTCTIVDSTILSNKAVSGGGVMGVEASGCRIDGNRAMGEPNLPIGGYGGGAYASTLDRCVLSDNVASEGGGALGGRLSSCLVSGNTAGRGGGIRNSDVLNCTVAGNSADEGGGAWYAGSFLLRNTILCSNVSMSGANYYLFEPTAATFDHCCTLPLPPGEGNMGEDPGFLDAVSGDYRLAYGSVCLNAGTNVSELSGKTDLDGRPRILGGTVDIGAYEATYGTEPATITITNAPVSVSYYDETFQLRGTNNLHVVGTMEASNATTGLAVQFPAASPWTAPALDLVVGENLLSVWGTNRYGEIAADMVLMTRSEPGTGLPAVVISTPSQVFTYDATEVVIEGSINTNVVGRMRITNDANGYAGEFAARPLWHTPPVPLSVGDNYITVRGTNIYGQEASAEVLVGRGGPGTGIPVTVITNENLFVNSGENVYVLGGTNNANVVGTMVVSNAANGAWASFPAAVAWTAPALPLQVGENEFTVRGGNLSGQDASDSGTVTRAEVTTHFVSLAGLHVSPYATWETAATTIQAAVDASLDGEQVLVAAGRYETGEYSAPGQSISNRILVTKRIMVRAVSGPQVTEIVGRGLVGDRAIRCAYLSAGATLSGFTVTNGYSRWTDEELLDPNTYGGGVFIEGEATVTNCIFSGNGARWGGGVYAYGSATVVNCIFTGSIHGIGGNAVCTEGGASYIARSVFVANPEPGDHVLSCWGSERIEDCDFNGNFGGAAYADTRNPSFQRCLFRNNGNNDIWGGAVWGGNVMDCVIVSNVAQQGGGLAGSVATRCLIQYNAGIDWGPFPSYGGGAAGAVLEACQLLDNTSSEGGGAMNSSMTNCLVARNRAVRWGGGIRNTDADNCTIVDNEASLGGGCFVAGANVVRNSIVVSNRATEGTNCYGGTYLYTCTFPLQAGVGNIAADPLLADMAAGDYRLAAGSPCIDAGDNGFASASVDLDGNPRISGGVVDMGAYECPGQRIVHVSPTGNDANTGLSWLAPKRTLQAAVDAAHDGDLVLATNGVYREGGAAVGGALTSRVAVTKAVSVRSVNGREQTVILGSPDPVTLSNGSAAVRCAYLSGLARIDGFTLSNGYTMVSGDEVHDRSGGGILLDGGGAVSNCVVEGCVADVYVGGIYCYDGGEVDNCVVRRNTAGISVGGVSCDYAGTVRNTLITENGSDCGAWCFAGGLLSHCEIRNNAGAGVFCSDGAGVVEDCLVEGNGNGGARMGSGGLLRRCTIRDNSTSWRGGGVYIDEWGTVENCLITDNTAAGEGGGIYSWHFFAGNASLVKNCTIVRNTASVGGGVYYFGAGALNSSIVYDNTAATEANYHSGTFLYCCTTPNPCRSMNITNAPLFVNPAGGDFHQRSSAYQGTFVNTLGIWTNFPGEDSPCIDLGDPNAPFGEEPYWNGGRVNIGAYGNTPWASRSKDTDGDMASDTMERFDLGASPRDPDTDYDGVDDWSEWVAGTEATNPLSCFRVFDCDTPAEEGTEGRVIRWSSESNRLYGVERSVSLINGAYSPVCTDLVATPPMNSFMDGATGDGSNFFYRIRVRRAP
ncbi:MAG: S8 family serine peptidase [bacterium]